MTGFTFARIAIPSIQWSFRTAFWIAAAVVLAAAIGWSFVPRPVEVETAPVTRGAMTAEVREEGRTRLKDIFRLSAPVTGRLLRVEVEPGDAVEAGQMLARLAPVDAGILDSRTQREAEAQVAAARAGVKAASAQQKRAETALATARRDAGRAETLLAGGVIAPAAAERARLELANAEAAHASAVSDVRLREAELSAARARLDPPRSRDNGIETVNIVSPVAGRVLAVPQESEGVVQAGTPVLTVGDLSRLEVVVELLSTEAVQVAKDAAVRLDGWGGAELNGRVLRVEPAGFTKISALGVEEQRVNVVVAIEAPTAEFAMLGHDYRVEAAIETWRAEDVIQAPSAALFRHGEGWAVFRAEKGRARLTPVETGRDNGRVTEIRSGVEEGVSVVIYPGEDIRDGARITDRSPG